MNNFIHSFRIKNFFSFKEQSEFSFIVDKKAPRSDAYVVAESGERVSKVGMIVGANASGKTHLFRALELIKKMIALDVVFKEGDTDPEFSSFTSFVPFAGNEEKETELSVTFNIGTGVYEYTVSFDNINKVVSREVFAITDKTVERKTKKEILSRVYDKNTKKIVVKFDKDRVQIPDNVESALSTFPRFGVMCMLRTLDEDNAFAKEIGSFWSVVLPDVDEVSDAVNRMLKDNSAFALSSLPFLHASESTSTYEKHPEIKVGMEEMLERFDTGVQGVAIKKKKELDGKGEEIERIDITTKHLIDGKSVDMDVRYDSAGTRQMYIILANLLKTRRDGGFVAIDEIDINLHPHILSEIMSMFLGDVLNEKNAQFMFSTHVHFLMAELDKQQIHVVEKDESGRSEVYRLDAVKGVRSTENYFGKYLAGAYGGIPRIQ